MGLNSNESGQLVLEAVCNCNAGVMWWSWMECREYTSGGNGWQFERERSATRRPWVMDGKAHPTLVN